MLGTLIEKLSSLLSKSAFLASFVPLLAFLAANAALLAAVNLPFQEWLLRHRADAEFVSGVVIGFFIASLLFTTLNTRLRELLEGNFWHRSFASAFTAYQQRKLQGLDDEYSALSRSQRLLERRGGEWTERLKTERAHQPKANPTCRYEPAREAARKVKLLRRKRIDGEVLTGYELQAAVDLLARELRDNPIQGRAGPDGRLDDDHVEVNALIRYARAKTRQELIRVFNERQFNFPDGVLAPTAMGNIALSIRSYALSRYQLNVETFWTRLQKSMQGEAFYTVLQESKLQLDFLVSMFWLTALSTAAWLIALAIVGHSVGLYLTIAIAGTLALWALYRLSLQNYRAFADLMRSAVDMYRLRLLEELQLRKPTSSRDEAVLWQALQDRMDYGKDFNLGYRRSE